MIDTKYCVKNSVVESKVRLRDNVFVNRLSDFVIIFQFMLNGVIGQIGVIVQNIVLEQVPKKEEQENVTVNGVWIMKV